MSDRFRDDRRKDRFDDRHRAQQHHRQDNYSSMRGHQNYQRNRGASRDRDSRGQISSNRNFDHYDRRKYDSVANSRTERIRDREPRKFFDKKKKGNEEDEDGEDFQEISEDQIGLALVPEISSLESNHHLLQVIKNTEAGYSSQLGLSFSRFLKPEDPKVSYRRRKDEVKSVVHWGQRKLLISEIEFLTLYGREDGGDVVVYAGAAPGTHTPLLIELFPQTSFILFDPAPFSQKLRNSHRVTLRQECFTDEIAQELAACGLGDRLLFICDIRSCDSTLMTDDQVTTRVGWDMDAQMRWHKIMKPRRSMLKFRLPWEAGKTEYLQGEIFLPIWGPITTTEARLITHECSNETCEYDNKEYEEQMFYFNTTTRVSRFPHSVTTHPKMSSGFDFCYDCVGEIRVLSGYLKRFHASTFSLEKGSEDSAADDNEEMESKTDSKETSFDEKELSLAVNHLSLQINKSLGGKRTLRSPNSDPGARKEYLNRTQYINGAPAYMNHIHKTTPNLLTPVSTSSQTKLETDSSSSSIEVKVQGQEQEEIEEEKESIEGWRVSDQPLKKEEAEEGREKEEERSVKEMEDGDKEKEEDEGKKKEAEGAREKDLDERKEKEVEDRREKEMEEVKEGIEGVAQDTFFSQPTSSSSSGQSKALSWMKKMGFSEGEGLGARGHGISTPIEVKKLSHSTGLGFTPSSSNLLPSFAKEFQSKQSSPPSFASSFVSSSSSSTTTEK